MKIIVLCRFVLHLVKIDHLVVLKLRIQDLLLLKIKMDIAHHKHNWCKKKTLLFFKNK